jgi:L-glutamine-phosphate cytidylyltransferase
VSELVPVVLAAGTASRLGGRPKCLLRVNGTRVLDRCVNALKEEGFDRLLVVTGHRSDDVVRYVSHRRYDIRIQTVNNPLFRELNNFHSVAVAVEAADEDVLIFNCDIIFAPDLVRRAKAETGSLGLLVEPGPPDAEAMKVAVSGDSITRLGKDIRPDLALGEFIGISTLRGAARARYLTLARQALADGETTLYYEDIYSRMCDGMDVCPILVAPGSWAEIDAPADLPAARAVAARMFAARPPAVANRARS